MSSPSDSETGTQPNQPTQGTGAFMPADKSAAGVGSGKQVGYSAPPSPNGTPDNHTQKTRGIGN